MLILDEPISGLDPRARIEIKALFKEIRRIGKTILIFGSSWVRNANNCLRLRLA